MDDCVFLDPTEVTKYLSSAKYNGFPLPNRDTSIVYKGDPKKILICSVASNSSVQEATDELVSFIGDHFGSSVIVCEKLLPSLGSEAEELWGEIHDIYKGNVAWSCKTDDVQLKSDDVNLENVDLVIAVGGDGTILKVGKMFPLAIPPVIGLSMGSMGYMAKFNVNEVKETLLGIKIQGLNVSLRSLLRVEIFSDTGELIAQRNALNECVIDRGLSPYITTLDVFYAGNYFTTVSGDGLLVGTPSGSTAYSMAAGGPIVHPNVPSMLFTVICPHSISYRPLVLPHSAVIEVLVPYDNRGYVRVCVDGNYSCNVKHGFSVRIAAADHSFPLVLPNDTATATEWCRALKERLHWNVRIRQQNLRSFAANREAFSSNREPFPFNREPFPSNREPFPSNRESDNVKEVGSREFDS